MQVAIIKRVGRIASLFAVLLSFVLIAPTGSLQAAGFYDTQDTRGWTFSAGINGGYNKLLTGWDNYKDLGNLGLDMYWGFPRDTRLPSVWYHNFILRTSFEWFPLQVPRNTNGLEEDIFTVNAGLVYQFHKLDAVEEASFIPFVGGGIGMYQDRIEMNTPLTGKVEGKSDHFGFNASAGIFLPKINFLVPFRLVPEARYHRMKVPDGTASNITYHGAIIFEFFGWEDK